MLTNEKVLDVFKEYLEADDMFEVVVTSHGYTVMGWDAFAKDWVSAIACPAPEKLRDALLDAYANYTAYHLTYGRRELTEDDQAAVQAKRQAMYDRCK